MKIKFLGKQFGGNSEEKYGFLLTLDDPNKSGLYVFDVGQEIEIEKERRRNIVKATISNLAYSASIVFKHESPDDHGHLLWWVDGTNRMKDFDKDTALKEVQTLADAADAIVIVDDTSDEKAVWRQKRND